MGEKVARNHSADQARVASLGKKVHSKDEYYGARMWHHGA